MDSAPSRPARLFCASHLFTSLRLWITASLVTLLIVSGSWAEIITRNYGPFTVKFYGNGDGAFFGYSTIQNWTEQQMADVGAAINAWDVGIVNTPGRQIVMNVGWVEFGNNTILGASGSNTYSSGGTLYNAGEHVWRDGWTGFVGTYDTAIIYDVTAAGLSWNFGSGAPASNKIDFRSVVAHEIGHSLGFDSSYNPDTDKFGFALTIWDQHLVDSNGNRPARNSRGTPGNFNEKDNPVYFDGTYSKAFNGGSLVAIYAPTSFSSGSSLVHLDEATFPNALMSPAIAAGQMIRTPTELEWAMMRDMGWNIIPEPASAVMLLGALGMWLLIHRRRRR